MQKIINKRLVHPTVLLIANLLVLNRVFALSTKHIKRIDVCQNKDCSRRFASNVQSVPLPQIIRDLLGNDDDDDAMPEICTTGCLSQCDKGPNIQIVGTSGEETVVQGVQNQIQAAAELQALGLEVHPKLLAAVTVLEKENKSTQLEERQRFIDSVLKALQAENLATTPVYTRALVAQANLHFDKKEYESAIECTKQAVSKERACSAMVAGKAYRVAADSYDKLGRHSEAIQALQQWAAVDPSFQTKINKEIQRIRSMMTRDG